MPVNHTDDILLSLHVLCGSVQLSLGLMERKWAIDILHIILLQISYFGMFNSLSLILKDFTSKIIILISIFMLF